jgi:hypothetical protein
MLASGERNGNGKKETYPLGKRKNQELLDPWSISHVSRKPQHRLLQPVSITCPWNK